MSKQIDTTHLRDELQALRARYDDGAVSPALYSVIRDIEIDLAWAEHDENRQSHRIVKRLEDRSATVFAQIRKR